MVKFTEELNVGDVWQWTLPGLARVIPVGTIIEVTREGTPSTATDSTGFTAKVVSIPPEPNTISITVPRGTNVEIKER